MNILLILTIIVCFAFIGYKFSYYYISRKKFFSSLIMLMSNLELDVNFNHSKIKDIIKNNLNKISSKELFIFCNNYYEVLNSKKIIEYHAIDNIPILKKDEKDLLFSFFSSLGKFDALSQCNDIKNYLCKINEIYITTKDEYKKYSSLFIKLGIMIGMLICLLIL